ncbi:MAG: cupin domain-containing protein [Ferruginibacter sp.]
MKKNVKLRLLVLTISVVFAACNGEKTKTTTTADATDSTGNTKMADTPSKDQDMDAVTVAPGRYKVAKDTMGIRVLELTYKPGDSSAIHAHPDNVLYVIAGGKSEFTMQDGSKQVYEIPAGVSMILPGGIHSVKNIGTTTSRSILVEVNRPNKAGAGQDAAMDAMKVAPNLYKLVKDTMNIRVLIATYKPGASSALHAHPDNAIYIIEGGTSEFTMKDGSKQQMGMEKGMIAVMPAGNHAVKNTGKTETKVLIVEVNRPVQ